MTDAALRAAHAAAVADLKRGESYAAAVPTSFDVMCHARRAGLDPRRRDVVAGCVRLGLALVDTPVAPPKRSR